MEIRVVAERPPVAKQVIESLRKQGLKIPSSHVLSVDSPALSIELDSFEGIVILATNELSTYHADLLGRLRTLVSCESKIALVSPVSAVVNHGVVLKAIRAGACDIISVDENLDDELREFLTRLSLQNSESYLQGRMLTIVPCSNTYDANLLVTNVATLVAAHSGSCGILDFHFRGGDLAIFLRLNPQHTILDLLNQTETIDDTMFRQALSVHENGVELLPGPPYFSDLSNVRFQSCQQLIRMAQHCWPVTVINAEDVQHAEQIRALGESDEIILTMRLDVASLHRTQKHVVFLLQNHVPVEHIHIFAMGTGHAGELSVAAAKKVLQTRHVYSVPDDPVAAVMSINIGSPLVTESPTSKAAIALKTAVDQIMGYAEPASRTSGLPAVSAVKAASLLAINSLCR